MVAILASEIIRILFSRALIDFSVTVDLSASSAQPRPRILVLPGFARNRAAMSDEAEVPNTCSSDTIRESLAHLKRAYWPLPWDTSADQGVFGSRGGFLLGAKAAVGEAMSAQLRAISTVANWRLERGIWTSPGAGDWRRCRAACERMILVSESLQDESEVDLDRRDLGVLLMMSGELDQAYVELESYESSTSYSRADGVERILVKRMLDSLISVGVVKEGRAPVSIGSTLSGPPPNEWIAPRTKRPLTW